MSDFDDIREGLWHLRRAFHKHHMNPVIVELADSRESLFLREMMPPEYSSFIFNGMDQKGNPTRQIEIEGVIVRWPAKTIAFSGGRFDYE